jgi:hypothetical protein
MQNASTSGVVLEDFDSQFSNRFYHSYLDNPGKFAIYKCGDFCHAKAVLKL